MYGHVFGALDEMIVISKFHTKIYIYVCVVLLDVVYMLFTCAVWFKSALEKLLAIDAVIYLREYRCVQCFWQSYCCHQCCWCIPWWLSWVECCFYAVLLCWLIFYFWRDLFERCMSFSSNILRSSVQSKYRSLQVCTAINLSVIAVICCFVYAIPISFISA